MGGGLKKKEKKKKKMEVEKRTEGIRTRFFPSTLRIENSMVTLHVHILF